MNEVEQAFPGRNQVLDALSIEIVHTILRSVVELSTNQEHISNRIEVIKAIEFIHSNLHHRVTLQDMASKACMSASHFSRVFKEETGTTPNEYLIDCRLRNAKKP